MSRGRRPQSAATELSIICAATFMIALLGLLPSLALLPAAGWTRATAPWLALRTGVETPGYSPVAVAGLLVGLWIVKSAQGTWYPGLPLTIGSAVFGLTGAIVGVARFPRRT
jgi:hypothetical protein